MENELAELKKQRGDRAFARRVYTVQSGDSYFSIAGQELGDEQWVQQLIDANPGIVHLYPGTQIILPGAEGEAPSISASDFTEINTAYEWGAAGEVANVDMPDAGQEEIPGSQAGLQEPAQPEEPMTAEEEDALVEQAAIELEQLAAPTATETPSGFDARKAMAALTQQTPPPPTVTPNGAISPEAGTGSRRSDEPYPQNRRGGVLPTPQAFTTNAPTSTPLPTPSVQHRTVQEGDTLLGIILETGVSLSQILSANNLDIDDPLQIGQGLVIPLENANPYKPTDFIIQAIQGFESYEPFPYNDSANNCTVGYGHKIHGGACNNGPEEAPFQGISEPQAQTLLTRDLLTAEETVKAYVEVKLTQNQFDALLSFAFNIGSGEFRKSQVLAELNAGNFDNVPDRLLQYVLDSNDVFQPGLQIRREWEGELFLK